MTEENKPNVAATGEEPAVEKGDNLEDEVERMVNAEKHLKELADTLIKDIIPGQVTLNMARRKLSYAGDISYLLKDAINDKFKNLYDLGMSQRKEAVAEVRKALEKIRPAMEGIIKKLDEGKQKNN